MRGSHGLLVLAIAATGCDVVFDLERDPPKEFQNYDRCGAFLYDEPLRYAAVPNPNTAMDPDGNPVAAPWSWDDARTACKLRGMDLVVFNDKHELGMGPEEAVWPYWIGQRSIGTAYETVDGCPAITAPSSVRLVAADAPACGAVSAPNEVVSASCDGKLPATMEPSVVTGAMCETPRPDTLECLGQDPEAALYTISDAPMSYEAARSFCQDNDAHLVVVETQAEWLHLSKMTKESWEKPFWIGAKLDAGEWKADNGCFGTYSWTGGTPGKPANGSCVAAKLRAVDEPEPGLSGMVLDGVAPTACDDAKSFALCEID